MRHCVCLIVCIGSLGCGGPQTGQLDLSRPTPGLELQTEDFARARANFATRLVREGPAPAEGEALGPLADADTVEYRSGTLPLRAYRSHPSAGGAKRAAVLLLHGGFAFGVGQWETGRPFRDAGFVVMMP